MADTNYGSTILNLITQQRQRDEENAKKRVSPLSALGGALTGMVMSKGNNLLEKVLSPEAGMGLLAGATVENSTDDLRNLLSGGFTSASLIGKQRQQEIENTQKQEELTQEKEKSEEDARAKYSSNYIPTQGNPIKKAYRFKSKGRMAIARFGPKEDATTWLLKHPDAVRVPEKDLDADYIPAETVTNLFPKGTFLKPWNRPLQQWQVLGGNQ